MMDIAKTLSLFWQQFDVPAYFDDLVPDDAELPYITFNVKTGNLNGNTILTAFNWHKNTLGGNLERTELLDKIATAIPVGGLLLTAENGYFFVYRNDVDFQSYWQDEENRAVIGGRTSYIVQCYNL